MPYHDWTRVPSGLFHAFHQSWSIRIMDALNGGVLTEGYYALVEQRVSGPEPDVITVQTPPPADSPGGTALMTLPQTQLTLRTPSDAALYAQRANRISVRHPLGQVVAIIEIVSPGNKDSRHALRSFVDKAVTFLRAGIHLLIVDLFPPTERDPQGIHGAIWNEIASEPFVLPAGRSCTLVSYRTHEDYTAFLEPLPPGAVLTDMPLYLAPHRYVNVPLESTYQATWAACPDPIRRLVEPPT